MLNVTAQATAICWWSIPCGSRYSNRGCLSWNGAILAVMLQSFLTMENVVASIVVDILWVNQHRQDVILYGDLAGETQRSVIDSSGARIMLVFNDTKPQVNNGWFVVTPLQNESGNIFTTVMLGTDRHYVSSIFITKHDRLYIQSKALTCTIPGVAVKMKVLDGKCVQKYKWNRQGCGKPTYERHTS